VLEHPGPLDTALLELIAGWHTHVGGRQTTGFGELAVDQVQAFDLNLSNARALTWWLQDRHRWLAEGPHHDTAAAVIPPGPATPTLIPGTGRRPGARLEWTWTIVDPIHVGDDRETHIDDEPDTDPEGDRRAQTRRVRRERRRPGDPSASARPVVPGTAWKGIFHHRVEHILRAADATEEQRDAVLAALFGAPGSEGTQRRNTERGGAGRRGLLHFANSPITGPDGAAPATRTRTHVSIDRIGGGAADGRLFDMEGVDTGILTLRIGSPDALPDPVLNLLRHVVWDLHDGIIGVGAATTRGYGTIALTTDPPDVQPVDVHALGAWADRVLAPPAQQVIS
jgi:hypothetical protein